MNNTDNNLKMQDEDDDQEGLSMDLLASELEENPQSPNLGSSFNSEEFGNPEEYASIRAQILSFGEAVSPIKSAKGTKTVSSFNSNDFTNLFQTLESEFPIISFDESDDNIEVISPTNSILSVDSNLGTTSVSTSCKAAAKKSTGSKVGRAPGSALQYSSSKTEDIFTPEQSLIEISTQLQASNSNNDSLQEVSPGIFEKFASHSFEFDVPSYDSFLDNGYSSTKSQLHGESSDEISSATSMCKIMPVASLSENNEDIACLEMPPYESEHIQLTVNKTLTPKCNVTLNEGEAVIFEDLGIRLDHTKSLSILSKGQQENNSVSYSEPHKSLLSEEGKDEIEDFSVVDIDELLLEGTTGDILLEENIDVEDLDEESIDVEDVHEIKYQSKKKPKRITTKGHKVKNKKQVMTNTQESFLNKSKPTLYRGDLVFRTSDISLNNPHSSSTASAKCKKKKVKACLKIAKSTNPLRSKSLLKPVDISHLLGHPHKINLKLRKKEILEKIDKIKDLTPYTLLDHLTEEEIVIIGGQISEDSEEKKPYGFARGLEPDFIVGAAKVDGKLMVVITWKGCDEADLVMASEANLQCPDVVIRYYEEKYLLQQQLKE